VKPELVNKAQWIASVAHWGQTDKQGVDYIQHADRVSATFFSLYVIAQLHDVVEDSRWTLEMIQEAGFDEYIVDAIDALTKRVYENYMEYIARCCENEYARQVKIMDLRDHLDNPGEFEGRESLMKRYRKALNYLEYVTEWVI
jgi:(p)ppGpp synthase/HD superfamily hydrolase